MKLLNTAHASYRVKDLDRSLHFYCDLLGMKPLYTITYRQYVSHQRQALLESGEKADESFRKMLEDMEKRGDAVWITYLEITDHQYLELFSYEGEDQTITFVPGDFGHVGYLHLALEVEDIHAAYKELKNSDVVISTTPNMGVEKTWQFWIQDPDGNAIELMQYTEGSWQLTGGEH